MQHFMFASKQVFYFSGHLSAIHVALYDLRTWVYKENISSAQWGWDMTFGYSFDKMYEIDEKYNMSLSFLCIW